MAATSSFQPSQYFIDWVKPLVEGLYDDLEVDVAGLCDRIFALIQPHLRGETRGGVTRWSEADVLLIAYGDSVCNGSRPPLQVMDDFLRTYLKDTVSAVHILPFFPYSSDDGFAVIDYTQVNPALGDWGGYRADLGAVRLDVRSGGQSRL